MPLYQHSNRQKIVIPQPSNLNQPWTTRLAFDGANGSTTITDSASSPKIFNVMGTNGTPWISTSASKYGVSSAYFPPSLSNSRIVSNQSSDYAFGTSDYTVDCWIYPTQWSGGHAGIAWSTIFDTRRVSHSGLWCGFNSSRTLSFYHSGSPFLNCNTVISLNTWSHVAVSRQSGTMRVFVNGVVDRSVANAHNYGGDILFVGRNFDYSGTGDAGFVGYIDELRVLNGIAVYTSNFTP